MDDIRALYGGRMCTEPEYQKCLIQHGDFIDWSCGKCEKKRWDYLHPWTRHMLAIKDLQSAGYPFGKNDLSIEEWRALGIINNILRQMAAAAGAPRMEKIIMETTADGQ